MTTAADTQASLEADLKDEIIRMYQEVADHPDGEFHFFHGREAAELFGYTPQWLDRASLGRNETGMWWRRHGHRVRAVGEQLSALPRG